MPTEAPPLPTPGVQVMGLSLHAVEYERLGNTAPKESMSIQFGIGTAWAEKAALGVELQVVAEQADSFKLAVSYRAVFKRSEPFRSTDDQDTFWKSVAAQVAPLVLLPYVRATVTMLVAQSGFPSFVLPLVNPSAMFSADEITLPEWE